jgi:hypothetical protein
MYDNFYQFLHAAQLANTVTGFATCLAGIVPMAYCLFIQRQPPRWFFVYFCILLTGLPTVWLHSDEGNRFASASDVGSNIFLTWSVLMAVSGDFLQKPTRNYVRAVVTLLDFSAIGWLFYEIGLPEKVKALDFGDFGQFYVGEVILILNAWICVGIFFAFWKRIPRVARPALVMTFVMFFAGMILATAANDEIWYRIFAWHAVWHIVGGYALVTLWLFNHLRFTQEDPGTLQ